MIVFKILSYNNDVKRVFVLILIFLFLSPIRVFASEDWIIESFFSDINIRSDGVVLISENIKVDFGTSQKHGIYRDIPYVYEDENGLRTYTDLDLQSVKQDGIESKYSENKNGNTLRIKIGDPNRTISGKHTYQISYAAKGVLRSFSNYDELYWNVTGNLWDVSINNASAVVHLPKNGMLQIKCFKGYLTSTDSCKSSFNENQAFFEMSNQLFANEGLTIVSEYSKGMVPIIFVTPPKNLGDKLAQPSSLLVFLLTTFFGILIVFWLWFKNGRDYWFRTPSVLDPSAQSEVKPLDGKETIVVEFEPPKKLRPAEIGVLLDEKADTKDVTATIIDLAVRGYLTITEIPKKWLFGSTDYSLKKTQKKEVDLLNYEQILFDRLFDGGESINVSSLKTEFYEDLKKVKTALYKNMTEKNLFVGNPESVRLRYVAYFIELLVLGIGALSIGLMLTLGEVIAFGAGILIVSIFILIFSRSMSRRSAYGRELYRQAKGYYEFINGAEKYRQQFYEKKNIFNEILPYAIVFGLTDKFAKAMKDMGIKPVQPTWYVSPHPFNVAAFSSNVNAFSNSFSSAIASTPSSSGGSGGFSGGGFGGGGGGSW